MMFDAGWSSRIDEGAMRTSFSRSARASVTYQRYAPLSDHDPMLAQLVDCYREVFAAAPWSEWKTCACCHTSWGIEAQPALAAKGFQHCGQELVDFWPRANVARDIRNELGKEGASCWLAVQGGKVLGFCWGYPITVGALEEKLGLPLSARLPRDAAISYTDEIGVIAQARGHGVAKELLRRYVQDAQQQGTCYDIARVKYAPQPSVTYQWFTQKRGYELLAVYPPSDGRAVIGAPLSGPMP